MSYYRHVLSGLLLFWVLLLYCTVIVHGCHLSRDSRTTLAAFASPLVRESMCSRHYMEEAINILFHLELLYLI